MAHNTGQQCARRAAGALVLAILLCAVGAGALAQQARRARARGQRPPRAQLMPKERTGLVPLTELAQAYKGEDGGLYGNGRNEPPQAHAQAARKMLAEIVPRNAQGRPAREGKIVFISVGMSNTTQEFSKFKQLADADPAKSPGVVIVDCAQGGQDVADWADPENRFRKDRPNPWDVLEQRLRQAGVTAEQVQVAWIKQARRMPAQYGEFPEHAREFAGHLRKLVQMLRERLPNLRIAYLSSRIYAGYATTPLNPEPYAYETAFAVRWLIQEQIAGRPELNYDPARGAVRAPLLLWGPYLWADGLNPRKSDGLVWKREDFARDGTHPSQSGREKVAQMLLDFLKTSPFAKPWFVGEK